MSVQLLNQLKDTDKCVHLYIRTESKQFYDYLNKYDAKNVEIHIFNQSDLTARLFIKGNIAELYVGLELLKSTKNNSFPQLYNWVREAKNSNAEVDYVIQKNDRIVPLEVKAGTKGSMQSLRLFMDEKQLEYGIRTSLENFGQYDKIKVIPLYATGNILQNLF
ncbi:MAG: DUF4143 domain-containing protein [Prevotellaceae bacterium]|nr:DUF4143 domain-containing protein [Prevotellaceae bacterium]